MTETKPEHTYEFGYAGNSYFNGSDGTVMRSDGKSIRINERDGCMAVNVKDRSMPDSELSEETKTKLAELNATLGAEDNGYGYAESYEERIYQHAVEQWWSDAEYLTTEDPERPGWTDGVHSAGRSGGWCVIKGTGALAEDFRTKAPWGTKDKPFIVGITKDTETDQPVRLDAFATEDEAAEYIDTLDAKIREDGGYYIDDCTEAWEMIEMRDEFLALAFTLVEMIDETKDWHMTQSIDEDFATLERKRNACIVRGEN